MLMLPSPACRRGQWSLIGSLVAVAILILLAALYLPKMIGHTAGPSGGQDAAIQKAYGVACSMYQSQMDQAASMYRSDHNGEPPTSMDDLKKYGVTDDMIHSPDCSFQIGPGGRVISAAPGSPGAAPGAGEPAAQGYGQPGVGGQPGYGRRRGAGADGGQPGPGGITIPNIPGSGDAGQ